MMPYVIDRVKCVAAGICSPFIVWFGVQALISAYDITHPQIFIMYFFSATFIIMVGLVLFAYAFYHRSVMYKERPPLPHHENK